MCDEILKSSCRSHCCSQEDQVIVTRDYMRQCFIGKQHAAELYYWRLNTEAQT